MGARPPAILKTRRTTCKCDICGRGFLNVQALRTHQSFSHPKSRQRVAYKPNTEVLAERNLMTAKVVKVEPPMPVETKKEEKIDENETKETTKLEFGCPKCSKLFSAYFHAYKHIQKNHCVNSKGEPVAPNSSTLIKPVRTEVCLACNLGVGDSKHKCTAKDHYIENTKCGLKCLGCRKEFCRIMLFDLHIAGVHSTDVMTMFFPKFSEYASWKRHMESQMQTSYVMVSNTTINDKAVHKRIYRCPFYLPKFNEDMAGFCPSSIILQEFPKGYQIHFHSKHYGHMCKPYKLDEAYKKYTMNYLMSNSDLLAPKPAPADESKMYEDFKKLMENITLEAEIVDADCLKSLFEKALEMSVVLNNRQVTEKKSTNKSITDDEISVVLNEVQTRSKRKVIVPVNDLEVNSVKKIKKEEDGDISKKNSLMRSPINFNDTFKDFVGSISCSVETPTKTNRRKQIVKTKIGQFKASPTKMKKGEEEQVKSQDKFDGIVKSVVTFDLPKVKSEFKFDLSKVKTEFDYEVKEQENDCNILILKIE